MRRALTIAGPAAFPAILAAIAIVVGGCGSGHGVRIASAAGHAKCVHSATSGAGGRLSGAEISSICDCVQRQATAAGYVYDKDAPSSKGRQYAVDCTRQTLAARGAPPGAGGSGSGTGGAAAPAAADQAAIEGAVMAWIDAARTGQRYAYCGLETNHLLRRQTGQTGNRAVLACVNRFSGNTGLPKASSLRFGAVTVTGHRARAQVSASGQAGVVKLSRSRRRWKIDGAGR